MRTSIISSHYFHAWMGTTFFSIICPCRLWLALSPFPLTLLRWNMKHFIFYKQGKVSPRDPVCIFCSLYHHFNSRGKNERQADKNLPRLPSGKVELKLERGITWTKNPSRERVRVKEKEKGVKRRWRQCDGLLLFSVGDDKTVGVNEGFELW